MWIGICVLMNLVFHLDRINIYPDDTTVCVEVSIHTLGAIGIGMVALFIFLICREHLLSIPPLSLAKMVVIHDGGLASD